LHKTAEQKKLGLAIGDAIRLHGHLGPFLVIGVKMGNIAKKTLKVRGKKSTLFRATVRAPLSVPFSCTIDGIQVTTHCTVGNQRLTLENWKGGIHGSFATGDSNSMLKVSVKKSIIEYLKTNMSEGVTNEELAERISLMTEDELFTIEKNEQQHDHQVSEEKHGDFEIAKNMLLDKNLTLCVVKKGRTLFTSRLHGVSSFLTAVQELKDMLKDSCVADRVVGKAVAFLCVYSKIRAVYASALSKPAKTILEKSSIYVEYDDLVDNVLNAERTGTCPFEHLVRKASDPSDAYRKLLNACGSGLPSKPSPMRG